MVFRIAKDEGGFSSHSFKESVLSNVLDVSIDTVRTTDHLFDILCINRDKDISRADTALTEYPIRDREGR